MGVAESPGFTYLLFFCLNVMCTCAYIMYSLSSKINSEITLSQIMGCVFSVLLLIKTHLFTYAKDLGTKI